MQSKKCLADAERFSTLMPIPPRKRSNVLRSSSFTCLICSGVRDSCRRRSSCSSAFVCGLSCFGGGISSADSGTAGSVHEGSAAPAGRPNNPTKAREARNVQLRFSRTRHPPKRSLVSGCLGLRLPCNLTQLWRGGAAADPEQSSEFAHSSLALGREFAADTHNLLNNSICLFPGLGVGRQHRRNRREGCFLIDQQHIELLTHQSFEIRERHVAVFLTKAACHFKAPLVHGCSVHTCIDQAP